MTWATRFRVRQALKGNLWLIPLASGMLGLLASYAIVAVDDTAGAPDSWSYTPQTALTVLTTVIAATVGLTGFVVTVSVLAIQMSIGSFSPRYMRLWYRDRVLKAVLAMLVGTFTFSFSLLRRIDVAVPNLGVTLAGVFLMAGLILFVLFLDRVIHRLRAVKVASLVSHAGRSMLQTRVAAAGRAADVDDDTQISALVSSEPTLVIRATRSGSIQAIHAEGLVEIAARNDCVLILVHPIGDFVSAGAPLAEIHGTPGRPHEITERRLDGMFALGVERTIEQDPVFALRVLVDIAIRALSPAVNDPTTAVQVMDHLGDMLRTVGATAGLDGRLEFRDAQGHVRVVLPAHRFEDFLSLGVTEIRRYGAQSIQVMRRLRAMLIELQESVLAEYQVAVGAELRRLDATVSESLGASADGDLASVADRQGIGGPRHPRK